MDPREDRPRCPLLPMELWLRILSNVTESNHLAQVWVFCRGASRATRAAVEDVYMKKHLPKTQIRMPSSFLKNGTGDNSSTSVQHFIMGFERLSEDRSRATFKNKEYDRMVWAFKKALYSCDVYPRMTADWKKEMGAYAGVKEEGDERETLPPQEWPYTIQVRNLVSDTELPELQVKWDEWELSVDWRLMFDKMFAEDVHARNLAAESADTINDQLAAFDKLFRARELDDPHSAWQHIISMKRTAMRNGYRDARRLRIKRWYRDHEKRTLPEDFFAAGRGAKEEEQLRFLDDKRCLLSLGYSTIQDPEENRDNLRKWYGKGLREHESEKHGWAVHPEDFWDATSESDDGEEE